MNTEWVLNLLSNLSLTVLILAFGILMGVTSDFDPDVVFWVTVVVLVFFMITDLGGIWVSER